MLKRSHNTAHRHLLVLNGRLERANPTNQLVISSLNPYVIMYGLYSTNCSYGKQIPILKFLEDGRGVSTASGETRL